MRTPTLILASTSPRRQELLGMTGLPFQVVSPSADEHCDLPPVEAVAEISRRKAEAVHALRPDALVLAADTLVDVDGVAIGKPGSPEEAKQMLRMLSGRWHEVHTGVCAITPEGNCISEVDTSRVHFGVMEERDMDAYIRTGDCMDKAGAYAVQGFTGLWIDRIEGSYTNVMGLPMARTRRILAQCGLRAVPTANGKVG